MKLPAFLLRFLPLRRPVPPAPRAPVALALSRLAADDRATAALVGALAALLDRVAPACAAVEAERLARVVEAGRGRLASADVALVLRAVAGVARGERMRAADREDFDRRLMERLRRGLRMEPPEFDPVAASAIARERLRAVVRELEKARGRKAEAGAKATGKTDDGSVH